MKFITPILILVASACFLAWVYASIPEVMVETGTNKPVACIGDETEGRLEPITSPACQAILKANRYEPTWVAPGWRP